MKIAFLHMTMGLVDRGAEVAMARIATGLVHKHQVTMYQSGPRNTDKTYTIVQVFPLTKAPPPAPQSLVDKVLFRLYLDESSRKVVRFTQAACQAMRQNMPDIVIAVNGAPQVKILKKQFPTLPVVVFGEAGLGYHDRDTLRATPDLFIALTEAGKQWAMTFRNPATRVAVIPNPIELPKKSTSIDLQLPHPIILTVGALTKYKNIESVIEAIRFLNASLILIGDGENSSVIAAKLSSLPNDFRWITHVEPGEMAQYYSSADVFCFVPQKQEAFGNVYIEAMAAGLAIVASDDPVRREIVGEKGFFADPSDPKSIATAIAKAVSGGKQDYQHELIKYSINSVVHHLEKELHALNTT